MYSRMVSTSVATATSSVSVAMLQHPFQRSSVERDRLFEHAFRRLDRTGLRCRLLLCRSSLAHSMGVSVSETTAEIDDGDRQRNGEFAEQPARDVAHEQQRNQTPRSAKRSAT